MLNDLKEIVAIPSVQGEPIPHAPFGKELRRALDWFLAKAVSYGLKTGENDGYYGYAEYGDENLPIIGILTHIDVVPAGNHWTSDPYVMRREGDMLYGRGVADNKAAVVMALHILKELKEKGRKLNHRIRIIVGCNEETGSRCMEKYAAEGEIPVCALVPDCYFPVTNSEKGLLRLDVTFAPDEALAKSIVSISGGERPNIVPDRAQVSFAEAYAVDEMALQRLGVCKDEFEIADGGKTVFAKGVATHACHPEMGSNAMWKLWAYIAVATDSALAKSICTKLCRCDADAQLGIDWSDAQSGALTMNMGVTEWKNGKVKVLFDFRIPVSGDKDKIVRAIEGLPYCEKVEEYSYKEALYISPDSPLVKILMDVYNEATGENAVPIQTGGGTYAKSLPNAVAYGMCFTGFEPQMHEVDERMRISDVEKAKKIYEKAIFALDEKIK